MSQLRLHNLIVGRRFAPIAVAKIGAEQLPIAVVAKRPARARTDAIAAYIAIGFGGSLTQHGDAARPPPLKTAERHVALLKLPSRDRHVRSKNTNLSERERATAAKRHRQQLILVPERELKRLESGYFCGAVKSPSKGVGRVLAVALK